MEEKPQEVPKERFFVITDESMAIQKEGLELHKENVRLYRGSVKMQAVSSFLLVVLIFSILLAILFRGGSEKIVVTGDREEICQPYQDYGYANGAIMAQRIVGECDSMKKWGYNSPYYQDNPYCDARKIVQDLYNENTDDAGNPPR